MILFESTEQVVADVRCKVIGTPYAYTKKITCTSIYEQEFANETLLVFYLEDEIVFDGNVKEAISIYINGKNIW